MDSDEARAIARDAVAFATDAGATQAEASVTIGRRFSVEARDTTITKLEQATGRSLALRIFVEGRKAALGTANFNRDDLRAAIVRAVAQARHVAEDRFSSLPEETATDVPDLELYDSAIGDRAESAGADDVLAIEREIRACDTRISNSSGSRYSDGIAISAFANSNGFEGVYTSSRASRSTSPVAVDGEHKRTAHYGTAGRKLSDLDGNDRVAALAVQRTVELFGARKPQTMRVPVIFERDVAAAVLADIFAATSAANVATDNSWLAGRVGDRIGSDLVTLVDDGRLPGLLGSSPFDGEGVATRRTVVMERGVLKSFLFDTYYARKLGGSSTGNSAGGSIGPNTFFLEAGTQSLEELIASTSRGVLVLDTIGFATEHATGSYSRGARGFLIENGELAHPIDEFTIAAPFPEMLAGIDGVGNDLRFDGSVVAPSFRVAEMTISGTEN